MNDFFYDGRDLEAMSFAPNYHHWILDHFEPFVGNTLTEIGAGKGTFSELLLNRFGKSLNAVEPSSDMFNSLKEKMATHSNGNLCKLINDFTFNLTDFPTTDTIFYVNVLEHIENDRIELKWMYDHLEANGHICLFSPALPSLFGSHDLRVGHFRRYTKIELVEKVTTAGFTVKKAIYFDVPGVPLWWVNFVLLKNTMKPGAVHLYDNWVVPILRKCEPSTLLPIGKNVLVVAQK